MDIFKEYMITRHQDGKDKLQVFLLVFICSLALAMSFLFAGVIAEVLGFVIFAIGAGFYGCYLFASMKRVEYEYIFTNGDMDVDKIMGQRKRKRLVTVDFSTLTQFGRISDEKRSEILRSENTVIDASDNLHTDNDYYIEFKHKSFGMCYLVFTPSEEFVDEFRPYFPRALKNLKA